MKKKFIKDEIYRQHFWLISDCSNKEACRFANANVENCFNEEGFVGGLFRNTAGDKLCLWAENNKNFTLDHEIIHLVFFIFNRVGVPITIENDEAFAYFYQYLKKKIVKSGIVSSNTFIK